MNFDKSLKIGATVAGLVVSLGTILAGVNYYIDTKINSKVDNFVPRSELGDYYQTLNNNNKVILDVLKTVGTSFYDATLLDVDAAIEILEDQESLTNEQKQQLDLLKLIRAKLIRDKNLLETMELKGLDNPNE